MRTTIIALFSLAAALCAPVSGQRAESFTCHLSSPGGDLSFGIEKTAGQAGAYTVSIRNGEELIPVPGAVLEAGQPVSLPFPHYNSVLMGMGKLTSGHAKGQWIKNKGKKGFTRMGFRIEPAPKFRHDALVGPLYLQWKRRLAGRWKVMFDGDKEPAVGVFKIVDPDRAPALAARTPVLGTFQTTLGDYRFLAGRLSGDNQVSLSCFDGAHAFLFHLSHQSRDDSLQGDFWSSDSWHQKWTATRDAKAKLNDAFALTKATGEINWAEMKFEDLKGKQRSLADKAFAGKVRILKIFGSWCPNCHDLGADLARLHRKYKSQGLTVVGLACELSDDSVKARSLVQRFLKRHQADYPVLLVGSASKAEVTKRVGFLDKVRSYPTTVFVDAKGQIRAVHQGYVGSASPAEHRHILERFEALITQLLNE